MKKIFLLIIISVIVVFSLAGCKSEIAEKVTETVEEEIVEEAEELETEVKRDVVEQCTVNLSVFNGNSVDGAANKVSKILEVKYKILEVGNAAHFDYPSTEIRLYTNTPYMEKVAKDIEIMLRNKTTISKPTIIRYPTMDELIDSDIVIVLGADCK